MRVRAVQEAGVPAAVAPAASSSGGVDAIKANGMTGSQISGKVDRKFSKGKSAYSGRVRCAHLFEFQTTRIS